MSITTNDYVQQCPECGSDIKAVHGFVAWCSACEWNVDPTPPQVPRGFFSRRAAAGSDKAARRLAIQLQSGQRLHQPFVALLVNGISTVVHVITILELGASLAVLALGFGLWLPFRLFIGLFLLAVGLYVQPFRRRRPARDGGRFVEPSEAPTLYALVARIAGALEAAPPDRIGVDWRYNASFGFWAGAKRSLVIGAALWVVLSPQERVSVLGHELGHSVNGDQRRALPVRLAVMTLLHWHSLFLPETRRGPLKQSAGLSGAVASLALPLIMIPVAAITYGLSWGLRVLSARQGMASEYYADELAARVAGTGPTTGALEKLLIAKTCTDFLVHAAHFGSADNLWAALEEFVQTIPESEKERQRRVGRLRLPAIDSEHPPSQLRADVLTSKPPVPGAVQMTPAELSAIERELGPILAVVARQLHARVK